MRDKEVVNLERDASEGPDYAPSRPTHERTVSTPSPGSNAFIDKSRISQIMGASSPSSPVTPAGNTSSNKSTRHTRTSSRSRRRNSVQPEHLTANGLSSSMETLSIITPPQKAHISPSNLHFPSESSEGRKTSAEHTLPSAPISKSVDRRSVSPRQRSPDLHLNRKRSKGRSVSHGHFKNRPTSWNKCMSSPDLASQVANLEGTSTEDTPSKTSGAFFPKLVNSQKLRLTEATDLRKASRSRSPKSSRLSHTPDTDPNQENPFTPDPLHIEPFKAKPHRLSSDSRSTSSFFSVFKSLKVTPQGAGSNPATPAGSVHTPSTPASTPLRHLGMKRAQTTPPQALPEMSEDRTNDGADTAQQPYLNRAHSVAEQKYLTLESELQRFRYSADSERVSILRDFLMPFLRTAPSFVRPYTGDENEGRKAADGLANSQKKVKKERISRDDRIARIYGFGNSPSNSRPAPTRINASSPDLSKSFGFERPHSPLHELTQSPTSSVDSLAMNPAQIVCQQGGLDESDEIVLQSLLKWWSATLSAVLPALISEDASVQSSTDSEKSKRLGPSMKFPDRIVIFDVLSHFQSLKAWNSPNERPAMFARYKSLVSLTLYYALTQVLDFCSPVRPLSRVTVLFVSKTLASAYFVVGGVSDVLQSALRAPRDKKGRLMRHLKVDAHSLRTLQEKCCFFPEHLSSNSRSVSHAAISRQKIKVVLSESMKVEIACFHGIETEAPTIELDFASQLIPRLQNPNGEMFFAFFRFWHEYIGYYFSYRANDITWFSHHDCLGLPGWLWMYSHIFAVFESIVHRRNHCANPSGNANLSHTPFAAHLPFDIACRHLVELLTNVADHVRGPFRQSFSRMVADILNATATTVHVSDVQKCFALCDLSEHVLNNFLFSRGSVEVEMSFWKQVLGRMISSQNDFLTLRAIGFIYSLWPNLDTNTRDEWGQWIIQDLFQPLFLHWGPMVRTHYMRLLCWRVIHTDANDSLNSAVYFGLPLRARLQSTWREHHDLVHEAVRFGKEPPSILPCNPIPNKRFSILPILSNQGTVAYQENSTHSTLAEAMGADAEEDDMISNSGSEGLGGSIMKGIMRLRNTFSADSGNEQRSVAARKSELFGQTASTQELNTGPDRRQSLPAPFTQAKESPKQIGWKFALEPCKQRRPVDFVMPPVKYIQVMERSAHGILPRVADDLIFQSDQTRPAWDNMQAKWAKKAQWQYAGRALAEWAHVVLEYNWFRAQCTDTDNFDVPRLQIDSPKFLSHSR